MERTDPKVCDIRERIGNPIIPIYLAYPKWELKNKWEDVKMRNYKWEYAIYKELEGPSVIFEN